MDAVYADPCHSDRGLLETLGPSAEDLALVLSGLPGVDASPVTHSIVAGRRAAVVTLTAPDSFAGCAAEDPPFRIWGLPETLCARGGRPSADFDPRRGRESLGRGRHGPGARIGRGGRADALVASIDLTVDPVARGAPTDTTSHPPDRPLPTLPATGPVDPGIYAFDVPVYAEHSSGALARLPGPYDAALQVPPGWFATGRGLALATGPTPAASLGVWTIDRVHLDPCRWQTGGSGRRIGRWS